MPFGFKKSFKIDCDWVFQGIFVALRWKRTIITKVIQGGPKWDHGGRKNHLDNRIFGEQWQVKFKCWKLKNFQFDLEH